MAKHDPLRLYPSGDGRYRKKIRGVLHHFGRVGGSEADAMREFLAVRDDLLAGRNVRRELPQNTVVTVKLVVETFLSALTRRVDGEGKPMKGATFDDYYRALADLSAHVGAGRDPDDLKPADFGALRRAWAKTNGPWALDRNVQAVRTMFRWALTHRIIDRQPFYGDAFGKTTEAEKRKAARIREREHGQRIFSADELAIVLEAVSGQLRAMTLLALNGGMYAADVSRIHLADIKREGGVWVLDFDRGKTGGVPWKFPLWPETVEAIEAVKARRPVPRDEHEKGLLFLTANGRGWHRENVHRDGPAIRNVSETHGIGQEFDKVLDNVWMLEDPDKWKWRPLKRRGVGFGTLRHTHVTAVGDHADHRAAKRVRGHKVVGIEAHYDKLPVSRLLAVTDLARSRLLSR